MSLDATPTATPDRRTAAAPWVWEQSEQPAFSPRRAAVPAAALELLTQAREQVVLGWFHRYPARFATSVVTDMIADAIIRADRSVSAVLDPFCGTGAVVSACRQLNLTATGIELTTLGATVSQLRLDPPRDPQEAANFCEWLSRIAPAPESRFCQDLQTWIGEENTRLLTAWRDEIDRLDDTRLRRFATVAISQSLRPSSRWLSGSVKVTADPTRIPGPIDVSLRRWARQLARDCSIESDAVSCRDLAKQSLPHSVILQADARAMSLADASVDAVVTSPPYFITYDYFDVQRLSYLAFDWPVHRETQVGAKYGHAPDHSGIAAMPPVFETWYHSDFRGEKTFLGRALRVYCSDMRQHLAETHRVVASGGTVAYSLANTVRAGRVFDLVTAFSQMLSSAGFVDVAVIPRAQGGRRILPAGRNTDTGRFSSDTLSAGVREYVVSALRP